MRYSLKQLAVFDAVADTGSVSLAADKLALTQSATSMSLAQLEKMLGRPLFERQQASQSSCYRGVESGRPPSTGIVAPVVGVWRVTKNRTAFATCLAVTLLLSRFRFR